jgi:hypothetical protein
MHPPDCLVTALLCHYDKANIQHVLACSLKWLCHWDEFGEIVWKLHHELFHMRMEVMDANARQNCGGSTWLPCNLMRRELGRFIKCCPCSVHVDRAPKQRMVTSIRSDRALQRVIHSSERLHFSNLLPFSA